MKKLFLPLLLFVAVLLRIPSLFEPNWYGDEGVYQVIGMVLHHGGMMYKDVWDNKPPLLYLLYGIFNGEQFYLRLLSILFMVGAIYLFYRLAKKLFENEKAVYLTTVLFTLGFSLPFLEGNIANAENFMLLPIIFGCLLALTKKDNPKWLFVSGLLFSTAFLFKVVGIFDLGAVLGFFTLLLLFSNFKSWFKTSFFISLGFLLPIIVTCCYFLAVGTFHDFFVAAFSQMVGYVGAGNTATTSTSLLKNVLVLKLLLLFGSFIVLFFLRKKLSWQSLFIYLWFCFSLFNAFFAGRPWTHYLLTVLPSGCLLVGLLFTKRLQSIITGVLLLISLVVMYQNFWLYRRTIPYYQNFIQYLSHEESEYDYRNFFDPNVNRDYQIADFVSERSNPTDTIYIWGDDPAIYKLANRFPPGRYTVAYHVTFNPEGLLETQNAIKTKHPKFFIVIRNDVPQELFPSTYTQKTTLGSATIYEQ